jgi:two-component system CheB/CheR fusion protein
MTETMNSTASEQPGQPFPVVGIGASAGGLAAFESFFSGMPPDADPGMAFVLVQHLAPDHKSILTDLVRHYTRMQVFEVEDGMAVHPNCVYVIPPNRDMAFLNGKLHLMEPVAPRGQRLPIDFFFRSLAQDQHERAICIVLSGTGSDGSLGVRAIKGEGGMAMAQSPATAEYDGMPRSAVAAGLVDYELPPAEMAGQLIAYASHAFGKHSTLDIPPEPNAENGLKKILILLRAQTGHDFSHYKPSTIRRRISRRLAVRQIKTIDAYVKYLQQTPAEAEALFGDLLIGVTSFFRDPDAFKALEEQAVPKLFAGKAPGSPIRVWSVGCSTGEEAYSIAILLRERLEAMKQDFKVQVFATDIDSQAIAAARAGLYPASSTADISPERLARYFTVEPDGSTCRIQKNIRDMLIFSEQDVIKDPPFSRLDLISCRNLLIYMGGELQKRLFPVFRYALNPGGLLFLGTSETVGDSGDLFDALDRKMKIYQCKEGFRWAPRMALDRFSPPLIAKETALPSPAGKTGGKPEMREIAEQALLQQVAPAAVLVNRQGDVLYLHGRTGLYLEPAPGEAGISNILKMAREGLGDDLAMALHKASGTNALVCCGGLRVKTNGDFTTVNLSVRPVLSPPSAEGNEPLLLVILEEAPAAASEEARRAGAPVGGDGGEADLRVTALMRELRTKAEYLQSANEEMQSTNEEMETSKEELQSINEELATINAELQTKVTELSRVNNDMNNLLAGTGIATVFVDHQLRILRFTPTATSIINLIQADVGRPVGHIASNLVGYDRLVADVKAVLDNLIPVEVEVQAKAGAWYTMRILPYRTVENVIEGVVVTFVDITENKRVREALGKAHALSRLAVVVHDARDAILVQDMAGRILAWNPSAERLYGWSEAEALKLNIRVLIPEGLREESLAKQAQLSRAEVLEPYRTQRLAKDGRVVEAWTTSTALVNEAGQIYAIASTERASV